MFIPLPYHRGQRKPWSSIPRINWDHPLARGLISYGYDVGCGPIDLVTGGQRTITNTGAPFGGPKSSKYGSGLVSLGGSPTTSLFTLPSTNNIESIAVAAPYSFAMGFMLNATPANFARLFSVCNATTGLPVIIGCFSSVATDLWFQFAAANMTSATGAIKINQFQTAIGVALDGANATAFVDGAVSIAPAALTTTQAATAGATPAFHGLRSGAGSGNPSGFIYYGALWKNRALRASEARLLHDDPYCFLIYPEDEMFAEMVGSGDLLFGGKTLLMM